MTHCANGHAEILHYEDACPLCAVLESAVRAAAVKEEEIQTLRGTIEDLRNHIDDYRNELHI